MRVSSDDPVEVVFQVAFRAEALGATTSLTADGVMVHRRGGGFRLDIDGRDSLAVSLLGDIRCPGFNLFLRRFREILDIAS